MSLDVMMHQLRDRTHWPPLPERPLLPATDELLAAISLTDAEVDALLRNPPHARRRVTGRAKRDSGGGPPVR